MSYCIGKYKAYFTFITVKASCRHQWPDVHKHISAFTFIFLLTLLLLVHNEHILEYYNTGWFRLLYFL